MSNEQAIFAWRLTLWLAPIIGGVIAVLANYKIDSLDTQIKAEKAKTEFAISEEKDNKLNKMIEGRFDRVEKILDENKKHMEEKSKTGDTYIVNSHNQSGGITAGKIEINVAKEEHLDDIDIPLKDNFSMSFDNATKTLKCHPRIGKWEQPFIAVPYEEKNTFIQFGGKDQQLSDYQEGDFSIDNVKFFAASCGRVSNNAKPATSTFFYYMTFNALPSYIIFGSYGKIAYKFNPSTGTVSEY